MPWRFHPLRPPAAIATFVTFAALVGCGSSSGEPSTDAAAATCPTCAPDADAAEAGDAADACIRATAYAPCCEGARWSQPSTTCQGRVKCAIWYTCKGGILYDDADNCHFMPCP